VAESGLALAGGGAAVGGTGVAGVEAGWFAGGFVGAGTVAVAVSAGVVGEGVASGVEGVACADAMAWGEGDVAFVGVTTTAEGVTGVAVAASSLEPPPQAASVATRAAEIPVKSSRRIVVPRWWYIQCLAASGERL